MLYNFTHTLIVCTLLRCSFLCCAAMMPSIPFRHLLWKTSNLLTASLLVVHVSEPYRSTPRTTALYTFLLVLRDRLLSLKTCSLSAPKVLLALAILFPMSCAIPPLASTMDPTQKKTGVLFWSNWCAKIAQSVLFYPFNTLNGSISARVC